MDLKDILKNIDSFLNKNIELSGWIRNHRPQKEYGFISFNDGTTQNGIQIVYDNKLNNFNDISKLLVGCAIKVEGILVKAEGKEDYEIKANNIILLGSCPED